LTLGHVPNRVEVRAAELASYYSVFEPDCAIRPGEPIAVAGMGLAATDVVMALTRGRGGRFINADGGLRYLPSGREPHIRLYSRTGLPQCAKAVGMRDITTTYQAGIWTDAEIARMRARVFADGGSQKLVWERDLYPLLAGEMTLQYYIQASLNRSGPVSAQETRERLLQAWRAGGMGAEVDRLACDLGRFDADRHFYPALGRAFSDSQDYHDFVGDLVRRDLDEALAPGGSSPVKMAYEVLRFVRDGIRRAVEYGGLEAESHLHFFAESRGRINRLVQGPPAERFQQLLALVEAGILTYPYGPSPAVCSQPDGSIVIRSTQLARPYQERLRTVVRGYIEDPDIDRTSSPLLANLSGRGRLAAMKSDGRRLGSVNLTRESHPIASDGRVQAHLWIFGPVTEGARYFTNVIPSPGSRVGPFEEASHVAHAILQVG